MTIYQNNITAATAAVNAAEETAPQARLVASHITKSFDGEKILDDVTIQLNPREIVCLLGVSGGGKTTLFNILSGLMEPEDGQVFLDGETITGKAGDRKSVV